MRLNLQFYYYNINKKSKFCWNRNIILNLRKTKNTLSNQSKVFVSLKFQKEII